MNDFNFNNINNLEIPDSWADKAIENAKNKKPIPVVWKTKTLAFVASLVLVCGLSVMMFLIFGRNEIPVAPVTHQTDVSVYNETSESENTRETEKSQKESQKPTDLLANSDETTKATEPTEQTSASTVKPSETEGIISPTATPTKPNESPYEPTDEPIVDDPSDPPVVLPTAPPTDPDPSEPAWKPSEPPLEPTEPTESVDTSNISVSVTIYKHLVLDDKKIYCKVYDANGVLLGDPNIYSAQHLTELSYASYYTAYYYPYRHSLITKSGNYTFVFYNSNGEVAREITKFMKYYP